MFSIGYDFHLGNGDNGNVYGITNYRDNSRNQSFAYDSLNRLTSAQNAGTNCSATTVNGRTEYWGNAYGYDPWGNLLAKNVTKCSAENLSVTVLTNNQLSGYSYDAAGNMTSDPTDSVTATYDAESRILTATSSKTGASASYTYNSLGNRVRKDVSGGPSTEYFNFNGQIVAELNPATGAFTNYVYFDGGRVARRDGSTGPVSYCFSDHLKTASVVTDASGNIKEDEDYYPWGGELQFVNNDSNHYKFTGKERDSETGLDDFGARYYSNGLGRFVTPDWSDHPEPVPYADFEDPQSLNQYSYVRNIPTVKVDADGHDGGVGTDIEVDMELVKQTLAQLGPAAGPGALLMTTTVGLAAVDALGIAWIGHELAYPSHKVGQSNADEIAERDRLDAENAQKPGQTQTQGQTEQQQTEAEPKTSTSGAGNAKKGGGDKQTGPGTKKDTSLSGRQNQLKDLQRAQRNQKKTKKPIDSTKKSEQNLDKSLKDIKSLEDAEKQHEH